MRRVTILLFSLGFSLLALSMLLSFAHGQTLVIVSPARESAPGTAVPDNPSQLTFLPVPLDRTTSPVEQSITPETQDATDLFTLPERNMPIRPPPITCPLIGGGSAT
ncbi:MAG: hypothetical protein IPG51_18535 [Chloroflexi bacterium]|nr:hypothetical protein [Chloroflexota bacterium]